MRLAGFTTLMAIFECPPKQIITPMKKLIINMTWMIIFCGAWYVKSYAQQPPVINIGDVFNKTIPLNLSKIASSVDYIPLETQKECLIGDVVRIEMRNGHIGLIAGGKAFLFDEFGKFVCKLGNFGAGPGEYIWARDIHFHPTEQKVFVLDLSGKKILVFDLNGNHLNSIKIEARHPEQLFFYNNSFIITNGMRGVVSNFIFSIDQHGNLHHDFQISCEAYGSTLHNYFSESSSIVSGKGFFEIATSWNDTIFRIFPETRKEAIYLIDYGKHKYPLVGKCGSLVNQPLKKGYAYQHWRALTTKYLFIHYQSGGGLYLVVYDRINNKIIHSSDIRDETYPGILNDLDGGPGITKVVYYQKNDGVNLVRAYQAIDLKESFEKSLSEERANVNSEANKNLKGLLDQISDEDNPIVQVIHLK